MVGRKTALILGLLASGAGCAYRGGATAFDPKDLDASWQVVRDVPLHRQERETDCGLAALAMVLEYWDIEHAAERVRVECPVLEDKGTRAKDLRECARKAGLQCYLVHGSWEDLDRELGRKHPMIVGMVKPYGSERITHYEVVVGLHRADRLILTLDPAQGWRQNSVDGFLQEWEGAACLLLVFERLAENGAASPFRDGGCSVFSD